MPFVNFRFWVRPIRAKSAVSNSYLVAAEQAGRDLTDTERRGYDAQMAKATALNVELDGVIRKNTARDMLGPAGFFDSFEGNSASAPRAWDAPAEATPPRVYQSRNSAPRGVSLREAMGFATSADREQIRALGNYLGGDMTALADLTPSGDGGVFIPTFVAGVVARNYSVFTPVRDAATVWPTANGDPTTFPVISDSEPAVILAPAALTGADATVSGDTPPTAVSGPVMGAYKFSSKPVFMPRETITDASLNVLEASALSRAAFFSCFNSKIFNCAFFLLCADSLNSMRPPQPSPTGAAPL